MKKFVINSVAALLIINSSFNAFSQCNSYEVIDWGNLQVLSGNSNWDNQIKTQKQNVEVILGIHANIYYSNSEVVNAYAKGTTNYYALGSIVLTKGMLDFLSNEQSAYWPMNLSIILSHEYGHLMQYSEGVRFLDPKKNELMSDYVAGLVVAELLTAYEMVDYHYSMEEIDAFFKYEHLFGDEEFGSIEHHGTNQERGRAGDIAFQEYASMVDRESNGQLIWNYQKTGIWYEGQYLNPTWVMFYEGVQMILNEF